MINRDSLRAIGRAHAVIANVGCLLMRSRGVLRVKVRVSQPADATARRRSPNFARVSLRKRNFPVGSINTNTNRIPRGDDEDGEDRGSHE